MSENFIPRDVVGLVVPSMGSPIITTSGLPSGSPSTTKDGRGSDQRSAFENHGTANLITFCDGETSPAIQAGDWPITTHPELAKIVLEGKRDGTWDGHKLGFQAGPEVDAELVGLNRRIHRIDETLVIWHGQPTIRSNVERRELLGRGTAIPPEHEWLDRVIRGQDDDICRRIKLGVREVVGLRALAEFRDFPGEGHEVADGHFVQHRRRFGEDEQPA